MKLFEDLPVATDLSAAGIDTLVELSREKILRGNHGRFIFARRLFGGNDIRTLPLGHLFDHRVRGVLPTLWSMFDVNHSDGRSTAAVTQEIEDLLWRMLHSGDHADARGMVAEALRLNPASDAAALLKLTSTDRALARHLLRGRLGTAARHIRSHLPQDRQASALALAARLLIHFSCLTVQIVAARAWCIEHPPIRLGTTHGPYRIAGLASDLRTFAELINHIGAYAAGKRKRYPNRKSVSELKPVARRWQTALGMDVKTLRRELPPLLARLRKSVRATRKWAQKRLRLASAEDFTLHKEIFGLTSAQSVVFSTTRLIQLRNAADTLLQQAASGLHLHFPADATSLPSIEDRDVETLAFVFRATLLDDLSSVFNGSARQPQRGQPDLRRLRRDHAATRNRTGFDLIVRSRPLFFKGTLERAPLSMRGQHAGRRQLTRAQALDVLPEYWLESSMAETVKVGPEPPTPPELLAARRLVHEKEQGNRPANLRRASGKDGRRKHRRSQ